MQGACFFALLNRSLTLDAPTPTNISTNSEPDILKKGTPASPATALASNVLPVPGSPNISTPLGILAPNFKNLKGFLRNSTISMRSLLASSRPATSANVTFLLLILPISLGLAPGILPIPILLDKKTKNSTISIIGKKLDIQIKIFGDSTSLLLTSAELLFNDSIRELSSNNFELSIFTLTLSPFLVLANRYGGSSETSFTFSSSTN